MTEQVNTPELRFPEFKEEWIEYYLGNNATIKGRLGWKGLKQSEYLNNGYAYLIANKHIKNGRITWEETDQINKFRYDESPEIALETGDLIFSKDGALGNPALIKNLPKPASINSTMMLVRLNKNNFIPNFFYQILLGPLFNKLIYLKVSGSSIPHLFQADMKDFKFKAPSLPEQEKIGNFFSKLDRQIELEEKKLELLEQQKRGYMQQIFSQELRFKDDEGKDYPLWKKYKLGDLYKKGKAGGTPKSTESKYYNGEIPFLSISDITEQGKFVMNTEKTITQEGLDNSTAWLVPINSINYAMYASVGYLSINKVEVATSQAIFNMVFEDNNLVEYIYYYLNYVRDKGVLEKLVGTGTQSNLSASIMKSMDIRLPSYHEMLKITVFLSKFDELVKSQFNKVEKLKQRKKGLLQKMFV